MLGHAWVLTLPSQPRSWMFTASRLLQPCDVVPQFAETVNKGTVIAMRDPFFNLIGLLTVTDKYKPDKVSVVFVLQGDGVVCKRENRPLGRVCSCLTARLSVPWW